MIYLLINILIYHAYGTWLPIIQLYYQYAMPTALSYKFRLWSLHEFKILKWVNPVRDEISVASMLTLIPSAIGTTYKKCSWG